MKNSNILIAIATYKEAENIVNRVQSISLESPPEKKECRLVEEGNVKELITLLQNEAKVIALLPDEVNTVVAEFVTSVVAIVIFTPKK